MLKPNPFEDSLAYFILTKNAVGWFDCAKKIIHAVPMFEHWEFFKSQPNHFPEIENMIFKHEEELDEAAYEHTRYLDEDEHPAWHQYSIWADERKYEFYGDLLEYLAKQGWFRIGKHKKDLFVDCPKGFEISEKDVAILRKFANEIEMDLVIECHNR